MISELRTTWIIGNYLKNSFTKIFCHIKQNNKLFLVNNVKNKRIFYIQGKLAFIFKSPLILGQEKNIYIVI